MKLIIQIPCLNEEATLPATLADLPREVARLRRRRVAGHRRRLDRPHDRGRPRERRRPHRAPDEQQGPGRRLPGGPRRRLKLGADVIVNTDADNQYSGPDIPKLVAPIVEGRADMVVGDRETDTIEHFSPLKKRLQRLGSWVVRQASDTDVPDTTSGFRAYNREAAIQMAVVSKYTYTLETIIQAGKLLVATDHVPIATNPKTRESRLFPSMGSYVRRNAVSIARIYAQYEPLKVFMLLATRRVRGRADPVRALRRRLHRRRRRRPRAVADLRRGAVQRRRRARRARDHRRPALRPAHDVPAHLRARAAHRAAARRAAVALRARRAADRPAGDDRRARPARRPRSGRL